MTFFGRVVFYGGAVIDLAKIIILVAIVAILTHFFIGTIFIVSGESMVPTFQNGQLVWSNKFDYLVHKPMRSDNVVVLYPGDPENKKYVKRIIGMPGENLEIKNGRVYLNQSNLPLGESYIQAQVVTEPDGKWQLKDDMYFLMGDNRPNSNDSRYFGPVEGRFIFGKATFIVWPDWRIPS